MIGLLVYDFRTSYLVEIVRGIDDEVSQMNYDLMLSTTHHHKQKESEHVQKLTQGMVDGLLIVLPSNLEAYLEDLSTQSVPYVLIDYSASDVQNVNTVQATNQQGVLDATMHLIDLSHERIGFVTGLMAVGSSRERLAGFRQAMSQRGLAVDESLVMAGDFMEDSGYQAGLALLQREDRPTAIVASNDVMAFGVIRAAHELGLEVPEDVSVVGFDDIPEAVYFRPKLTTVRQPLQEMGRMATRILVDMIENPDSAQGRLELATELIVRDSTAAPKDSSKAAPGASL